MVQSIYYLCLTLTGRQINKNMSLIEVIIKVRIHFSALISGSEEVYLILNLIKQICAGSNSSIHIVGHHS